MIKIPSPTKRGAQTDLNLRHVSIHLQCPKQTQRFLISVNGNRQHALSSINLAQTKQRFCLTVGHIPSVQNAHNPPSKASANYLLSARYPDPILQKTPSNGLHPSQFLTNYGAAAQFHPTIPARSAPKKATIVSVQKRC